MRNSESNYGIHEQRPNRRFIEWRSTLYPNGEFTFARQKRFNLPPLKAQCERTENEKWSLSMVRMHGVQEAVRVIGFYSTSASVPVGNSALGARLDLSMDSISAKKAKGLNGITSKGRRIVRNACYLLEKSVGKDRLSFLTLTLPSLSREGYEAVAGNWGAIVEAVSKAVRRRLEGAGLPSHVIGVTEVQEKRFRSHGGIPLHLHLVFIGRHRRGAWAIKPGQIRKSWKDAVINVLPKLECVPSFRASENISRVRKSSSAYLGKYMSKGVESIALLTERWSNIRLPHQWHTCTRALRQWIEREKIIPNIHQTELIIHAAIYGDRDICKTEKLKHLHTDEGRKLLLGGSCFLTSWAITLLKGLTEERLSLLLN